MKWKFENFKRGPLLTLVGVGLIGAAVYIYLSVPDSDMFAMALLGTGCLCLGLKDPRKPGASAGAAMIALLLLSSCVTYKKCAQKFGSDSHTHSIVVRDTIKTIDTVYVQADSVKGSIDINDLLTGKIDSLVHTSSSTKLQLKFWYDKYTRLLHYRADLKTDTVIQIKDRIVEVKGDCPDTVVLDKDKGRTGIGKVIRVLWENLEAVLLLALLVFFIVGMMYYKYKTRVRS